MCTPSMDADQLAAQQQQEAAAAWEIKPEGDDLDNSKRSYFYCKVCPMQKCSPQSWKKARVWGWTEDEAKHYLIQHLVHSGHHQLAADAAKQVADAHAIYFHEGEEPPLKQPRHHVEVLSLVAAKRCSNMFAFGSVTFERCVWCVW